MHESSSEIRTDLRLLTMRVDEYHRDLVDRLEAHRLEEASDHQRLDDRLRWVEKVAYGACLLGAVGLAAGGQLLGRLTLG